MRVAWAAIWLGVATSRLSAGGMSEGAVVTGKRLGMDKVLGDRWDAVWDGRGN